MSEAPLGRRDHAGRARIGRGGHAQRSTEGLEGGLGLVVGVHALEVVDVQRDQRVVDETLEELVRELGVEAADRAGREGDVQAQARAAGEVDHHPRQRFVERHVGVAVAADAGLVTQRLREGHAQRDAHVLDGVVTVDVQVALGVHRQVHHAVARHLVEHVVEEADAGLQVGLAAAVQVQADEDAGLLRVTAHLGAAGGGGVHASSFKAASKAASIWVFSSGVPTVTRRQPASSGCRPETFLISTPRALMPANIAAGSGTRTRTMLASLGKGVTPGSAAKAAWMRARSARMTAAWRRYSSSCSSANSAASALSTLTLKGGRSLSSSPISARRPIR